MKRRILLVVGLALALGVMASQGDWKMRVHRGPNTTEFLVSGIDSLTFYEDVDTTPMVLVPAGSFIMGDGAGYCGVDEHQVTLTRDFYLGQHEVTNHEYLEAVQWAYDHGYAYANTGSVWDNLDGSAELLLDLGDSECEIQFEAGAFYLREVDHALQHAYPDGYDPSDHPVKEVTWYGAARFCDWLSMRAELPRAYEHNGDWSCNERDPYGAQGYRLPTDAEWEFAAQWDDERIYPWGNVQPDCGRANYGGCVNWTSPVGSYPDAPEALGLSDMAGNVWEWCNDRHLCDLGTDPVIDPTGPDEGHRVRRGSGWADGNILYLRCASRYDTPPDHSHRELGFRVAKTVAP
jgi:formylglycine-generating enzyme required for sulfatase activity